ncbi:flagellar basal body P-ring formation chaperone FlgA [Ensifer soli]|uniref:flagellar basal body P-ring formation chaperone FlgA n=1 Tax=Ciceribacter sp. sgz301302 TaxID=3342379 RepID=UPI0035BA8CF9
MLRSIAAGRRPAWLCAAVALGACLAAAPPADASPRMAVVPTQVIYPGEVIDAGRLEEVEVTNPDLSGDYATSIDEIRGMVSKRTLLPGRVVFNTSLREAYAVARGSSVRLVFQNGPLVISATGSPLQDASIGDLIRVRNIDSGVIVSGTVMADGSIQVVAK